MIWLVFTACLIGSPHRCMTVSGGQYDTGIECMLAAEPAMVGWVARHPGWEVRGMKGTCQEDEPEREEEL